MHPAAAWRGIGPGGWGRGHRTPMEPGEKGDRGGFEGAGVKGMVVKTFKENMGRGNR